MSRYYQFQIEVKPCTDEEGDSIVEALAEEGLNTSDHMVWGNILNASGSTTLSGGEVAHESHHRLRKRLEHKFTMVSRWLCLEDRSWDEEVYDDEWKD